MNRDEALRSIRFIARNLADDGAVLSAKYLFQAADALATPAPALAEDVCPKCGNSGWLPRKDPSNPRSDNVRCQECANKPTPAAGAAPRTKTENGYTVELRGDEEAWSKGTASPATASLSQIEAGAATPGDVVRPTVVCLCGSTRFKDAYTEANRRETLESKIVLSVGLFGHADGVNFTPELKAMLDELHKRKIDLADEVLILNVGGYVGESTRSELAYAIAHGKRVRWLEPGKALNGQGEG